VKKAKPLPDLEYLRQILSYDEETGLFYWKCTKSSNAVAGKIAGCKNGVGYICIRIDSSLYLAHRIAWYFLTGIDPSGKLIDHMNCVKHDNRASNLRLATYSQNLANQCLRKNNTSGCKGVDFHKKCNKWRARIKIDNKEFHLGYFDTPELAHMAYCKHAVKFRAEFAREA